MRVQSTALILASASAAAAQSVVGTAYGFATGVTGGGSAAAAAPADADELASWLSDSTARTILIDQEYDFTGTTATGSGCDRKSCSVSGGGQYYLGDLSCGGSDNVAVASITYDAAGPEPLKVGSNKSIISSNGKGVLRGKGLSLASGASNVIIQGIEITEINPAVVWGGDAIDFQGNNDGVWVDHCKISLIGRQFAVSHYDASRITLSNNEFDGVTTTSAACNGNHYWTMMFIADGDQITLDRNYFHDLAGRAPKLGADGVSGTFQASNNYFYNMGGHAFDAYNGASALLEGNVFDGVDTPITSQGASVNTLYTVPDSSAASACESVLGRACEVNSLTSSGDWASLKSSSVLSTFANVKDYLVTPVAASQVAALVVANAGPANLGSSSSGSGSSGSTEETADEEVVETPAEDTEESTPVESAPAVETTKASSGSGSSGSGSTGTVAQWGQCGGNGYSGPTGCASGLTCTVQNDWYSQCL